MDVFVDVPDLEYEKESPSQDVIAGNAMAVGSGTEAFRVDQSGMWLGAAKYADAPFKVSMAGAVTMTSATITGYVEDVGGTYDSAASGARVRILPDSNTGIQIIDDSSNNVFLAYVGGTDVGDVIIGDYAGGNGVKWDKSAGDLLIKGDMTAGSIDGVDITGSTFKTGSTGTRVEISSTNDDIRIYDSGNDEVFRLDDEGGYITYESFDTRNINFVSSGGKIYFDDRVIITDSGGMEFTSTRSSALSYSWGFAPYKNGANYGWVSEMEGGTWNFAMNAGTP